MVFILSPQAPAVKIADLKNSKGCWGLNVELLTWDTANGSSVTFAIGIEAQNQLNGPPQTVTQGVMHAGFYGNGFTLADRAGEVHRQFQQFADELWVRNFGALNGPVTQVAVNAYLIG